MPGGTTAEAGWGTYLGDLDLDGSVVLGANKSVGGGALAGDVEFYNSFLFVLHGRKLVALK